MILTLFIFSAVKSVPASSAVARNSSSAPCSVTERILTQAASFFSLTRYCSPVVWFVRITADVFLWSEPLPLPKRSFISVFPSPSFFFDFASTIFAALVSTPGYAIQKRLQYLFDRQREKRLNIVFVEGRRHVQVCWLNNTSAMEGQKIWDSHAKGLFTL